MNKDKYVVRKLEIYQARLADTYTWLAAFALSAKNETLLDKFKLKAEQAVETGHLRSDQVAKIFG